MTKEDKSKRPFHVCRVIEYVFFTFVFLGPTGIYQEVFYPILTGKKIYWDLVDILSAFGISLLITFIILKWIGDTRICRWLKIEKKESFRVSLLQISQMKR